MSSYEVQQVEVFSVRLFQNTDEEKSAQTFQILLFNLSIKIEIASYKGFFQSLLTEGSIMKVETLFIQKYYFHLYYTSRKCMLPTIKINKLHTVDCVLSLHVAKYFYIQ